MYKRSGLPLSNHTINKTQQKSNVVYVKILMTKSQKAMNWLPIEA